MTAHDAGPTGLRARTMSLVEHPLFGRIVMGLIVINAITLGLETSERAMDVAGPLLIALDRSILAIFVIELVLRIFAHGWRFFTQPWSLFDLFVVTIALIPATGGLSVLRALRILRVLRMISVVPSLRRVVGALVSALPGMGSIVLLLCLVFYVFSVMATKLYGDTFPQWFGSIGGSAYSLFQIMTLESWSMGIVRPVMEAHPFAWAFFVPFILVTSFAVLNLFIGIMVNAMQTEHEEIAQADREAIHEETAALHAELKALRGDIGELRAAIAAKEGRKPAT